MMGNQTVTEEPTFIQPHIPVWQPEGKGEQYVTQFVVGDDVILRVNDALTITTGLDTVKYAKAAKHPLVAPALRTMLQAPFRSGWHLQANNDYKERPEWKETDQFIINLIRYQMENLRQNSFEQTLKALFRDAYVRGYPVAECDWVYDPSKEFFVVNDIKVYNPADFDFYTDEGFNLNRIYYRPTNVYIHRDAFVKFLIAPYPYIAHGNYFGESALEPIIFDLKVNDLLEQAIVDAGKRFAVRPIIHVYLAEDMDKDEKEKVIDKIWTSKSGDLVSLAGMQDSEGKLMPKHTLEVMEDRSSPDGIASITNFLAMIQKRITRNFLPDDLGLTTTDVGSNAKAMTEMNLFTLDVIDNQQYVEDLVNRIIIPAMLRYNYPGLVIRPDYHLPTWHTGTAEEEFDFQLMETFQAGKDMELLDEGDKPWMREKLGWPVSSITDSTPTEEEEDTISGADELEDNRELPDENKLAKQKRAVKLALRGNTDVL